MWTNSAAASICTASASSLVGRTLGGVFDVKKISCGCGPGSLIGRFGGGSASEADGLACVREGGGVLGPYGYCPKHCWRESNKCYLMDCGAEVFVWVGRATQVDDRRAATQAAEEFLTSNSWPKATLITRLIQGYETHSFKSNFDSWPSSTAPSAEIEEKWLKIEGKLQVEVTAKYQKEGIERATFWLGLGGKENVSTNKVSLETIRDPHLFAFSLSKSVSVEGITTPGELIMGETNC
ncbi:hypothetical protein L1987_40345 [Smallanthus sonchifolius]|uniref:Uncharacterized protein n=1 Tax=Smallanthus sonchifolius TaxID=185202 RepID=A0ACB9GSZ5_9ASTR|nr:hypothetical protein L1987_40345 [Smallanthus sonchifolius]